MSKGPRESGSEQVSESSKTLREVFDSGIEKLVLHETGRTADEIRAMSLEERRKALAMIGVNIPEAKPQPSPLTQPRYYNRPS